MTAVPPFGQADLGNCDREPIHLAGAVQPHGLLLVLREPTLEIVQCSANARGLLGHADAALAGTPLHRLGGDLAERVRELAQRADLQAPAALRASAGAPEHRRRFEGALHRHAGGGLILELEPLDAVPGIDEALRIAPERLSLTLAAAVQRISAAPSIGVLCDAVVQLMRELTGYDRVMVYRFDPDGHGKVISEARDARLAPLLGHHYPASDIPRQARALYLKNRVRMLGDVDAVPAPLEPARLPLTGQPLDMSMCPLRAMSPIHLQYLRNMGVTASMSASLVREGQLWGLVAAHHHAPRRLGWALRTAVELLSEVASTRITAIENYAHAQVALMVRRLEQRLVEATSTEGDWRYALFRNPRTLLQPLDATGVVLFHDDELLTAGEVPSTPELRALLAWVRQQAHTSEPLALSSIASANPELASLTPTSSGVLAVRLSSSRPDYLLWLRKEQLLTVTWAGDPSQPKASTDPMDLSPRRSFAAWSEIVRGTAVPWSTAELALARAVGIALVDISVQVQAVRLLIAEHQLGQIRASMTDAREPVLVCDAGGRVIFANTAFAALVPEAAPVGRSLAALFVDGGGIDAALAELRRSPQPWRRELDLAATPPLPVAVRAEAVTGRNGQVLGHVIVLGDLREARRADAARQHLEASLREAARGTLREADDVVSAILTNASLAAMDIADARGGPPVAPLLEEVEAAAWRAAALYERMRALDD